MQRNKDQESPISSVVATDPPREPHSKERSSRLMLLRLPSCFLKARSSFCSWSQETASLLKNYIFPSSTLTSLCKHQDIVGDGDRPEEEGEGSYPVLLLRRFIRWWLLFTPYHPQLFNFHTHCLAQQDMRKRSISKPHCLGQLPALVLPPKKATSMQKKEEYPKVRAAKVNHDH